MGSPDKQKKEKEMKKLLLVMLLIPAIASADCIQLEAKVNKEEVDQILFAECPDNTMLMSPTCAGDHYVTGSVKYLSRQLAKCDIGAEYDDEGNQGDVWFQYQCCGDSPTVLRQLKRLKKK